MNLRAHLLEGLVIPAHPLALTADRKLDERRQRALTRYYAASGAGGIAVGVHTTQFAIREAGLYEPVLAIASETADSLGRALPAGMQPSGFAKIAGLCGDTRQAVAEAETALRLGYHAGLLSLGAWRSVDDFAVLAHCRAVAEVIPLFGFYLQPAVGGRVFGCRFWREFAEIPQLVAIKIAPFNRYQTLDVVRAVAESGREDVALYTGNDDNIVADLLTPFQFGGREVHIDGGLLGQWAVWTSAAVDLFSRVKVARQERPGGAMRELLGEGAQLVDANAALFDAANGFAGCIAGIHEVLRRQGLLAGTWCLDPHEGLSPGQVQEIDRVLAAYPHLQDDDFVAERLDDWLS